MILPALLPALVRAEIGPAGYWVPVRIDRRTSPSAANHSAIVDAANDRLLLFTGGYPTMWQMPLTGEPSWRPFPVMGAEPAQRLNAGVAHDPVRGRMIVYGGSNAQGTLFGDVWALALSGTPKWTLLAPAGTPPPSRTFHTMTYDPVRDRMLVFGGVRSGERLQDAWALNLSGTPSWSQLAPSGTPPAARYAHAAAYDPLRDRLLIHGGYDTGPFADMHALGLSGTPTWNPVPMAIGGPPARRFHAFFYDPVHDGLVLHGGSANLGNAFADTWTFSFATEAWTEFAGASPGAHWIFASAYDAARQRILIEANDVMLAVTCEFKLEPRGWTRLVPAPDAAPLERAWHAAVHDPLRERMLIHGGSIRGTWLASDTWALAGEPPTWSRVEATGTPHGAERHALVFDPLRDRMIVFRSPPDDSTPVLEFSPQPSWSSLRPTGPAPSRREAPGAVYDPVRDRVLLFGGLARGGSVGGPTTFTGLNDLWQLTLGPSPAWTQLATAGPLPPGRGHHGMVYDAPRDRIVVIGGQGSGTSEPTDLRDLWTLSLAGTPTWSPFEPLGEKPQNLHASPVVLDASRQRAILYAAGGDINTGAEADSVFALSLEPPETWGYLDPGDQPRSRLYSTAVYDPVRDRLLSFGGGSYSEGWSRDTWELRFQSPVTGVERGDGLRSPPLLRAVPNPSAGAMRVAFTLREREVVALELYDLAGRRLARRELGVLGHGEHEERLNETAGLPAGLYMLRLVRPRETLIARVVHVR